MYQHTGEAHLHEWTSSEETLLKCVPLIFGALQIKEKQETINKMVCLQQFYRYLFSQHHMNWFMAIQIIVKYSNNVSLGLKSN